MFQWLLRSRPLPTDLDQLKSEKWSTRFGLFHEKRFVSESGKGYLVDIEDKRSRLAIVKPRLFAWSINPWYRYRDAVVSGDFSFDAQNGTSAVGFVLRYVNDENYYFCLVSTKGLFRFDVVFNGTPIVLIPWVSLPLAIEQPFELQAIAHGQHFSFYINKEWIAETADDHIDAGRNGWCAQNYADRLRAQFFLHRFTVESRPTEVELQYLQWTRVVSADPAQRRVLAQTYFGFGKYVEAQIQMRRAFTDSESSLEDRFFMVQCAIRLERLDDALRLVHDILAKEPTWELALREKANLLYLQNRFLELRDYLVALKERLGDDESLWNLNGHAELGLGNWDKALSSYRKAAQLNPRMPIFQINVARTYERLKQPKDAARSYLAAAKELFRQEGWSDLEDILVRLEELGEGQAAETNALRGKLLFQQGDHHRAKILLVKSANANSEDSAVYYLLGILAKEDGNEKQAIAYLEKAIQLEPDYALYRFRHAEYLHSAGKEFESELQRALELAPADPWVLNFRGLTTTSNTEKTFYLEKARLAAPYEASIVLNLSDHYHRLGRRDEAFDLLLDFEDRPEVLNHKGNLLSRERKFDDALAQYEAAIKRAPLNVDYKENAATCALELQMYLRAEELLLDILDLQPSQNVYTALGNLMRVQGDFVRAEVSLRSALEIDPTYVPALVELGHVYLARQKFPLTQGILKQLARHASNPLVEDLDAAFKRMSMEKLSCASCSRVWWVPLQLPPIASIKIHGEIPDEAPAGTSPTTHKIYCVGCAQKTMKDGRFLCPDSGEFLQFKDSRLKYLVQEILKNHQP